MARHSQASDIKLAGGAAAGAAVGSLLGPMGAAIGAVAGGAAAHLSHSSSSSSLMEKKPLKAVTRGGKTKQAVSKSKKKGSAREK